MSNAVILSGFLPAQAFTGNPLDRHSDLLKRFQVTFNPDTEVSLIVVSGRDVVVRPIGPDSTPGVHQDLQALLLRTDDPELDLQGEELMLRWTPSEPWNPHIKQLGFMGGPGPAVVAASMSFQGSTPWQQQPWITTTD